MPAVTSQFRPNARSLVAKLTLAAALLLVVRTMVTSTRLSPSLAAYTGPLNWIVGNMPTRVTQAENSEVLLLGSVAVAVMIGPVTAEFGAEKLKLALQDASVVTLVKPRKVSPSPLPDGSQAEFAKNSILNCVFGVLFKVPRIVVVVESAIAEVITGKFCGSMFGPTALSQLSFGVTPRGPRSIPMSPFEKIELPRIAFPVP